MDGSSLSDFERLTVEHMECDLRHDRGFDRRVRRVLAGRRRRLLSTLESGRSLAALCLVSLTLMITGMVTAQPLLTVAFAGVWVLTVVVAAFGLFAWSRRRGL
ncbi:DUF3040 domain-containing protein [Streptomyces sp. NPDC059944]|uniref:DUF3040 domain-containing protein n=1 Tax=unclassified Streptomyces TaxID=2593676 RepID=UPI00363D14AE